MDAFNRKIKFCDTHSDYVSSGNWHWDKNKTIHLLVADSNLAQVRWSQKLEASHGGFVI